MILFKSINNNSYNGPASYFFNCNNDKTYSNRNTNNAMYAEQGAGSSEK